MFKDSIKVKVITLLLVVALIPFTILGITSLVSSENAVDDLVSSKLEAVRDLKKQSIEEYFGSIESQVRLIAGNNATVSAMRQFDEAFTQQTVFLLDDDIKNYWTDQFAKKYQTENNQAFDVANKFAKLSDKAIHFQNAFIGQNPSPLGEKNNFLSTPYETEYDAIHNKFHPWFERYLNEFGYYDIFLVNLKGEIVYSVFKELDFATSLETGPWANTGIAEAYRAGLSLNNNDTFFTDLALYAPSYDAPAGFVSSPVFDGDKRTGVLIFQMPLDKITSVMSMRSGMGETGESYLIGQDKLMRSDSYLDPDAHSVVSSFRQPEKGSVDTVAAYAVLSGETGLDMIDDYNGNPVVSAYTPVMLGSNQWGLLVEIDVSEAFAISATLEMIALITAIGGILFIVIAGYFFSNRMTKPIMNFAETISNISRTSDFSSRISTKGNDEIAQAGNALNTLLSSTDSALKEVNVVMSRMANGDFSQRVTTDLNGDLKVLQSSVNDSIDAVESVLGEVDSAVASLANGNFAHEISVSGKGKFAQILTSTKVSMNQLNIALIEIRDVMELMSTGDFSGRVKGEVSGDLQTLSNNINQAIGVVATAIDGISEVVAAQAAGDLTKELPSGHFHGQLHDLKNAINYSSMKMLEAVQVSSEASTVVSQAAHEVDQGAADLSSRVQEQAAALEQTSATMDEMNSQVRSNSENALSAQEMASEMFKHSEQGTDVMHKTIEAMQSIEESSEKINDIVSLIDGIAFQTNLLALNAAVEAARAGEHGRGFAVVAGEVRALAQKAGDAAKDIKGLVEETKVRVESGSTLARDSGQMLEKMNELSKEVTEMISQIAVASSEQAQGVDQVHQAITQIDDVTQQNAALVEETTAAAESLSFQSKKLQEEMSFFNTGKVKSQVVMSSSISAPKPQPKMAQIPAQPASQQPKKESFAAKPPAASSTPNASVGSDDEWSDF